MFVADQWDLFLGQLVGLGSGSLSVPSWVNSERTAAYSGLATHCPEIVEGCRYVTQSLMPCSSGFSLN